MRLVENDNHNLLAGCCLLYIMKFLSYLCRLLFATSAFSAIASQVEIEFRYFHDNTGESNFVQKLNAEERDGAIQATINDSSASSEAKVSLLEFDQLIMMMRENVAQFEFETGTPIAPPYIEIQMTYTGDDHGIQVTEVYAEGETPFPYVQMQQRYFQRILQ